MSDKAIIKSNYKSPIYNTIPIKIEDIVSQKVNPNSQRESEFKSLQISIFNQGFVVPVLIGHNDVYDPSTKGQERPNLLELSDGAETMANGLKIGTQVSDDEVAKYFPYRLIDGSHRSQIMRLGKYYFDKEYYTMAEKWFYGKEIPKKAGEAMLAYLAWRDDFVIPSVLVELDSVAQMSAEILSNSARGSSGLESLKHMVKKLLDSGKSPEWISENLNIDIDSIAHMRDQSGLKADYSDYENVSKAWTTKNQNSYERKMQSYLTREATKYINTYQGDKEIPTSGTAVSIAEEIGFNVNKAKQDFINRNK